MKGDAVVSGLPGSCNITRKKQLTMVRIGHADSRCAAENFGRHLGAGADALRVRAEAFEEA